MSNSERLAATFAALDSLPESDKSRVPLLIELMAMDDHDRHEDIVFDLGLFGDPTAIATLAKAAKEPPQYIVGQDEWGNLHEFQRKCAYALARICTVESRQVLEHLSQHADPYLRKYGEEGLNHWPMPYVWP
ncbi:HEAT repeat domain-containing protein [Herbaspirillum sp. alder98]|uniref:HEAT repeat domain-containing protein n=1 Tax=Herbaspirillum sp. alder98 TaxID=2913096 RepID=UPI001CD82407|nr:HEAT repeat domain-containing protein [Herbaspirillum sp. alder98]MCA1326082.1 HEAT repeat domain-containing protein [Herbaspirillum sp. alder98]